MPEFPSASVLLCLATALGAGIVRGFAGFGAAMILTPVFSAVYGPATGVPLCLLLEFVVALPLLPRAVGLVDWRRICLLLAAATVCVPFGLLVLTLADPAALRWALSGIVLAAVLVLAAGWSYRGKPALAGTLAAGAASGFLNGLAGMAGPPIAFYLLAGADGAAVVRASFIVYFTAVDLVALAAMGACGLITLDVLKLAALFVVPYVAGGLIGERLFPLASETFFRRLALIVLACMAVGSALL